MFELKIQLIHWLLISFIERSFHLILTNALTIFGLLLLLLADSKHANILYMGVIFITCGTYANVSVKIAWFNNNLCVYISFLFG